MAAATFHTRVKSAGGPKLPGFYYRLSGPEQRAYLASDAIATLPVENIPRAQAAAAALAGALSANSLAVTAQAAQALVAGLCHSLRVAPATVEVRSVRPRNSRGELHGMFYPGRAPRIVVWMRTARRHEVVKARTFLRTLLHEVVHYLDYRLLRLPHSFHTQGFFKRESFLMRLVSPPDEPDS